MSGPDERDLLRFADELARHDRPNAPAALRARLRASLLAAPVVFPSRRVSIWVRLRPVLAAVLVVALLAAVGGSAAASSLPGDPAFALKRAAEEVEVLVAFDEPGRLDALVRQADRRLADLQTVTARRPSVIARATEEYLAASARVAAALTAVQARPQTPARDAAIERASEASAAHLGVLEELAERLPEAAQPGIQRAIEAQEAVHGRSVDAPVPAPAPVLEPPGRRGPPSGAPGRP